MREGGASVHSHHNRLTGTRRCESAKEEGECPSLSLTQNLQL